MCPPQQNRDVHKLKKRLIYDPRLTSAEVQSAGVVLSNLVDCVQAATRVTLKEKTYYLLPLYIPAPWYRQLNWNDLLLLI